MQMQHIRRLPRNIHGPMRSSIVIFDFPRVVEELVNNSLDAGSTKVCVFVNVRACCVEVQDDGCGITRDELVILGEKHATSKSGFLYGIEACPHVGLGFKGEALFSLSYISIVEVRTKARGKPNAYHKIIKGSRCLFLGIDDQREGVGTTVIVRDLFYNQPVRRRYMRSSSKKVLHCVKKVVVRAAFVHPHISFKLIDTDSEDELLCTIPSSSPIPLVSSMFGNEISGSLREITFSCDKLKLSGYISCPGDACSTKVLQYLFVNSRFVSKGPVHNLLNSLASSVLCSSVLHAVDPPAQAGKKQKIQANPAFILNLCCPLSLYDLHFEPSKTIIQFKDWDAVLAFFEQTVRHFWQQYLTPLSQGCYFPLKNDAPEKSITQNEEISIRDTAKSFNVAKKRLHRKYPHNPIAIPVDFKSQDIAAAREHGKSTRELRRSFMNYEPCQINNDYFGEANSLQYFQKDVEHFLDSRYDDIGSFDNDRCEDAASSIFLQNRVISEPIHQFEKKQDIVSSGWKDKYPEGVGNSSTRATLGSTSDLYDSIANAKEVQFSPRFYSVLGKSGTELADKCSLVKNMNFESANYSRYSDFDIRFGWSRSDIFLHDNRSLNSRDTFPLEIVDSLMHSPYTIRKCQTTKHVDVSSTGLVDSYSFNQGGLTLNNAQMLDIGLEEWDIKSICGSPSSSAWHARPFRTVFYPSNRSTSEEKLASFEGYRTWTYQNVEQKDKDLCTIQDRSVGVLPNINTITILDGDHLLTPVREIHQCYPSDEMGFENVFLSSKTNGEISFFSSDSFDFTDKENDLKPKLCDLQKDNTMIGNLWDEQDFSSQQFTLSYDERSRSQSAPPFYRGKCKFSVLCGYLTAVAEKKPSSSTSKSLSEPACHLQQTCASQPCPESLHSEDSQAHLIKPCNERPITFDIRYSSQEDAIYGVSEYSSLELPKWRLGIQQTTDGGISHVAVEQTDDILNISSGLLHFSSDSLVPESIDKGCLHDAKVLFQVDKKFIPVIASGILMIIDQHAADERIRLEQLHQQVLSGEGRRIAYLDSEEELVLPEMGFQLLQKYAEKIQKWGWIFNTRNPSPEFFTKNLNLLKRNMPCVTLVAVPCVLGIPLTDKDLHEYIHQLVETDGSSSLPPSILRILNFKACRGAIMFGDSLLPSECSLIVEELKATSLCFQCAHGRPTAVPLLNMSALHEQLAKLKINQGGPNERWHGLCHRRPSIRHAQLLLDSAKRFQTS